MDTRTRKEQMFERYGQPEQIDVAGALREAGLRDQIHSRDAVAFRYASMEAALAFAESNFEHHEALSFGPYRTAAGPIAIVDLRPWLRRNNTAEQWQPTDPALPDDAKRP